MGLDIQILPQDAEEDLLYLRNHSTFFEMLCANGTTPVHRGYSDFFIDDWMLDSVEDALEERWPEIPADTPIDEDDFESLLVDGDTHMPAELLKPLYTRLVMKLRDALDEHGELVCAWSA